MAPTLSGSTVVITGAWLSSDRVKDAVGSVLPVGPLRRESVPQKALRRAWAALGAR
jgi:hypothetical protein